MVYLSSIHSNMINNHKFKKISKFIASFHITFNVTELKNKFIITTYLLSLNFLKCFLPTQLK